MRFKCGLTKEEEEAARDKQIEANLKLLTEGEVWFAWYPVEIAKGECRWLEKVRRTPESVNTRYYYNGTLNERVTDKSYELERLSRTMSDVRTWKYSTLDN